MAKLTTIAWCDHTFNAWIGCTKIAPGCAHCYAEADMDKRRGRVKWGPHGTRSRTSDAYWRQPLKWDRAAALEEAKLLGQRVRRRVFCASLADVFEEWHGTIVDHAGRLLCRHIHTGAYQPEPELPRDRHEYRQWAPATMDDLRRDLFNLIDATPNLNWLLLTKRPQNVRDMWEIRLDGSLDRHGKFTRESLPPSESYAALWRENLWLGASLSDQPSADAVLPRLLECRALCPVLFLSCEPLLGPVDLSKWLAGGIDWVIVGGESNGRTCNVAWIQSIIQQCRSAGVPCFVKQVGSRPFRIGRAPGEGDRETYYILKDRKGGDMEEWPEEFRVREFPAAAVRAGCCGSMEVSK